MAEEKQITKQMQAFEDLHAEITATVKNFTEEILSGSAPRHGLKRPATEATTSAGPSPAKRIALGMQLPSPAWSSGTPQPVINLSRYPPTSLQPTYNLERHSPVVPPQPAVSSPRYSPASPRLNHTATTPPPSRPESTSPLDTPEGQVLRWLNTVPASPALTPGSPAYSPDSPTYTPCSPAYASESPAHSPPSGRDSPRPAVDSSASPGQSTTSSSLESFVPCSSPYIAALVAGEFARSENHATRSPSYASGSRAYSLISPSFATPRAPIDAPTVCLVFYESPAWDLTSQAYSPAFQASAPASQVSSASQTYTPASQASAPGPQASAPGSPTPLPPSPTFSPASPPYFPPSPADSTYSAMSHWSWSTASSRTALSRATLTSPRLSPRSRPTSGRLRALYGYGAEWSLENRGEVPAVVDD